MAFQIDGGLRDDVAPKELAVSQLGVTAAAAAPGLTPAERRAQRRKGTGAVAPAKVEMTWHVRIVCLNR